MSTTPVTPTESTQPPATPTRTAGRPGWMGILPWILVAALTGTTVFFGTMWAQTKSELDKAKATPVASAPQNPSTTPAAQGQQQEEPQAPKITAQPMTGGNAADVLKLARRTANDPMAVGKADAPITLVEWADYRCPFCAKWALETKPELMKYVDSGQLRIEFRDMPIFGAESELAHMAARAAGQQGKYFEYYTKIWQMHTGNGHPAFTQADAERLATEVGVTDMARFKKDMTDPTLKSKMQADAAEATKLGIKGTPFFLVNTTPISGALPTSSFVDLLKQYGAK